MEHNNQKLEFFSNPAKWPFMAIGPCATNSENGVSLKRAITIYRGPFVYIFHYFTLMYKFCTLLVNF